MKTTTPIQHKCDSQECRVYSEDGKAWCMEVQTSVSTVDQPLAAPLTTEVYIDFCPFCGMKLEAKPQKAKTKRVKREKTLTENDWIKVFAARCQSKQGRAISKEERALLDAAYKSDKDRYAAMNKDIFNATVPFGSTVRK